MPLHPEFPIVEGRYQMTRDWSVVLPSKFNRRFEDGSLVLWQPGLTAWISVWGNDKNETQQERLNGLRQRHSSNATSVNERKLGHVLFYTYRLAEQADDNRVPALYCFAFGENGHVQMAIYFNKEQDLATAQAICYSLSYAQSEP